jgi:hypothetical protein
MNPQAVFLVDYPCERHCQVELDLTDMHKQFTLRQMWASADHQHGLRHKPAAERTPIHDGLAATFREPQ